jgi:hypothetical protein
MIASTPRSTARHATQIGLITAATGIAVLYVSGTAMPVVPPGFVLLVLAAVLVGFVRRFWTIIVGLFVIVAELAGFFASGSASALTDANSVGVLAGTWIRLVGLLVALAASLFALRDARTTTSTA